MTQKYFIGKCGGEDCMFRTGVILGEHQCLKDIEKCSKERCQNCPHGKTLDEMCKEIHRAICNLCCASANDACNKCIVNLGSIEDGLKALLGGGGK